MDHTAVWSIVPNLAVLAMTVGMVTFAVISHDHASRLSAQVVRPAVPAVETPENAAA
jgi:hypothetical protein